MCYGNVQYFVCLFVCFLLGKDLQLPSGCQGVSDTQKKSVINWEYSAAPTTQLAAGALGKALFWGLEGPRRTRGPACMAKGLSHLAGDLGEGTSGG